MSINIRDKYSNLTNFFVAYIYEADLDGFASDEEVAQHYAATESSLLLEFPFPWEQISDKANRDFQDEQSTRQGLQKLIEILADGAAS